MAEARVTQLAILVLADHVPCLTRWAQTWTITRADGTVLGFTSLDRNLTFRGVVHKACDSLAATAVEMSTVAGQMGSQEIRGLLSAAGVSEEDLENGLYDGAFLESWMVPWINAGGEIPFRLMAGTLGVDSHDVNEFSLELLTDSAKLNQTSILEVYTPGCRYTFGNQNDSRCPVDLTALTVSGSVTSEVIPTAPTNAARRVFTDSALLGSPATPDGFFNLGRVTWTSGLNAGATSEVKDFVAGTFTLWNATLFPIAAGDTYDATPGCDKSEADHLQFNADMVDFGGKPHVPGNDSIAEAPDAKET
jgi:uncharacterized phage protein (TIGR02218 family)